MKKLFALLVLAVATVAASAQELTSFDASVTPTETHYGMENAVAISRHRIAVDVGYSYRTATAYDPGLNEVDWRSGVSYGATYHWMFKFGLGVGANLMGQNYSPNFRGSQSNVNNIFVGPSVMYRLYFTKARRVAFVVGMSTGYLHYHERLSAPGDPDTVVNSGWIGSFAEAGLDFRIAAKVHLGFTFNILSGSVAIPGVDNVREDLGAVGIRAGVRF